MRQRGQLGDGASNADFYPRQPGSPASRDILPSGDGAVTASDEGNRIVFTFVGRFDYTAPPTTGQTFDLFTIPANIKRGDITELGIGSPQFDWFGTNEYYFAINGAPPANQQYQISGGPGPTGSFFGFLPIGTLQRPYHTKIPIHTQDKIQFIIPAQSTPAAGTVQYNIFLRVGGVLYR